MVLSGEEYCIHSNLSGDNFSISNCFFYSRILGLILPLHLQTANTFFIIEK